MDVEAPIASGVTQRYADMEQAEPVASRIRRSTASFPDEARAAQPSRIQRATHADVQPVQRTASGNTAGLPDRLQAGLEGLSGFDLSPISVEYNSSKPAAIGALAATQGTAISVGPGQAHHLPHEAWHVVQQMEGRVQPTTWDRGVAINDDPALEREADVMGQRAARGGGPSGDLRASPPTESMSPLQRRVPEDSELRQLMKLVIDFDMSTGDLGTRMEGPGSAEHLDGLRVVLRRQVRDLRDRYGNDGQPMKMLERSVNGGKTIDEVVDSGQPAEVLKLANDVLKIHPEAGLLAPERYMAPPADAVESGKIRRLVDNASAIFDQVAAHGKDAVIIDIFGAPKLAEAKAKMAHAKTKMLDLLANNKIVTDRSGYSGEVSLGGMSAFNVNILLPSGAIDNPDHGHAIATMFHEAMHAGNSDVKDNGGYVGSPGFKLHDPNLKLANAAHYEVIALRHHLGANPVWDGVFSPPGAAIGGSAATVPDPTDTEQALVRVSEMFRRSWTASLWLHDTLLDVYKNPARWTQAVGMGTYASFLNYWSIVLGLTLHHRAATIDPSSADKAKKPVTQIDMSLIESVAKRFSQLGRAVPKTEAEALMNTNVYPGGSAFKYAFRPEVEAAALAADLLSKAGLMDDPVRDKAAVDALCTYFSTATGTPMLAGQQRPSDYPS